MRECLLLVLLKEKKRVYVFSLEGRELAWQFVEDNCDELNTRGLLFSRLIKVTFVIQKLYGR